MQKKLITLRMSEEDLKLIDVISKQLSEEHKINFDRTKTLEYLVRWEYENILKNGTK